MSHKVLFNVLAKDLVNAMDISSVAPDRVLVGVMVKNFRTNEEAIERVKSYMEHGVLTSVGLGAGDPNQWQRVALVSAATCPYHINQVLPASGYTLGKVEEVHKGEFIINSLIEPSDEPDKVYIATGASSSGYKEKVSCDLAAALLADVGLRSVKFFPIEGNKKLKNVRHMVRAAVKQGISIFEPTGGIDMDNVHEIVKTCLDEGAETVIPHLYTSLVDKETGMTKREYIEELVQLTW